MRSAAAARERVGTSLTRAADRGQLAAGAASALERLSVSTDPAHLTDCGLVVEAVPEQTDIKAPILAAIESAAPDAWIATNTSSLSVDALASALTRPDRFIGLHFFNPVPASQLVEIVVGARTAPDLLDLARVWVADLGKTPIAVTDSPGFASSRLGVAIALEAMRMLEEGVATAQEIDTAMGLGYKHPAGPLRTTDIVGLDVRLAIAEHLARELGDRFSLPRSFGRRSPPGTSAGSRARASTPGEPGPVTADAPVDSVVRHSMAPRSAHAPA